MAKATKAKSAIGKGLAMLLSDAPPTIADNYNGALQLECIDDNPNNPRKRYSDSELHELSESIKSFGLIQPITVRPVGDRYEVVAGSKRYRASKIAGATTVAATIRGLSDEQALEIAIIENLQRSDVHPLEEANAFLKLIKSSRASVSEIAVRFGKSESFVRGRIKLNDLCEEAQDLFFNDSITLSDAIAVSRYDPETQSLILQEGRQYDGRYIFTKWILDRFAGKLNKATFPIDAPNLINAVGPCTTCQFNTANQLLFSDDASAQRCVNVKCFNDKTNANFDIELNIARGKYFQLVTSDWRLGPFAKKLVSEGFPVLVNYDDFNLIEKPEPIDYEEFKSQWLDDNVEDDEEMAMDWKAAQDEYNREFAEYNDIVELGNVITAFVVEGSDKGKYVEIELKDTTDTTSSSLEQQELALIKNIETREERAKELDTEKIQKRVGDTIKSIDILKAGPVSPVLSDILLKFLIWESIDWSLREDVCEYLQTESKELHHAQKLELLFINLSKEELYTICNMLMVHKYKHYTRFDSTGSYFLRQLATAIGVPVETFISEQNLIAEKRAVRAQERIEEIKAKSSDGGVSHEVRC